MVSLAHAGDRITQVETSLKGTAEIIHVEPDLRFWVRPEPVMFNDMIQHTRTSNVKSKWGVLLVAAESVDLSHYLNVEDASDQPFVERAREVTLDATKGNHADIDCYAENHKGGVLICRLTMSDINISEALISEGFSRFTLIPGMDSATERQLQAAESDAKQRQKGIWRPLYGLFRFPQN